MKGETRKRIATLDNRINTTKLVKLYILHYLIYENNEEYGLEIVNYINKNFTKVSNGLVYPLLRDLEENLYLTAKWEDFDRKNKRLYKITDEGIEHYKKIKVDYFHAIEYNISIYNNVLSQIYKKQ
ncbi:MAG: PadR family transcriptional regulator [Clostridium sulfidigenes]|uniref:PadR family transcriptional regulator n=1 Tax=Clostridium sulfidigenes TaxID=318464 RepID=A0A927W1G8_9CLOT|nr:PadR family transcriptional regulator [Clostridium sulfidigenes]